MHSLKHRMVAYFLFKKFEFKIPIKECNLVQMMKEFDVNFKITLQYIPISISIKNFRSEALQTMSQERATLYRMRPLNSWMQRQFQLTPIKALPVSTRL